MNAFIIEDCHGSYIRKDATTGRFVSIRSKNAAMKWDDYNKAMNVLNNCLSREQKQRFIVSELFIPDPPKRETPTRQCAQEIPVIIPQKEPEIKQSRDKKAMISQMIEDVTTIDVSPWEVGLAGLLQFAQGCEAKIAKLTEEQSKIDKEIVDIQHYIEFTNLSSYHGFLIYKALRSKLRKRREIKDELEILRCCENGKDGIESLQAILNVMQFVNNKSYSPRILEELFT